MILGNTGYIVYKFADLLPVDNVRRGMRPALFRFEYCDGYYNTKENRGSIYECILYQHVLQLCYVVC